MEYPADTFPADAKLDEVLVTFCEKVAHAALRSLKALEDLNKLVQLNPDLRDMRAKAEEDFVSNAKEDSTSLCVLIPSLDFVFTAIEDSTPLCTPSFSRGASGSPLWMRAPAATYDMLKPLLRKPLLLETVTNDLTQLTSPSPQPKAAVAAPFIRPLLAMAACADRIYFSPEGNDVFRSTPCSHTEGVLLHFSRAMMPPDLVAEFPDSEGNWGALLSDEGHGLQARLKARLEKPCEEGVPCVRYGAMCFLEALEVGPQLFNRGTLLNVEDVDTPNQRFCADVQMQTMTVFHGASAWQWRLLALPSGGELKDPKTLEKYKRCMPREWPKKGVDLKKDDPVMYAMRTKFNKMQIGVRCAPLLVPTPSPHPLTHPLR